MHTVTAKVPENLHVRLEKMAAKLDRKKSYLIRQAIEEYLEDMEDYIEAKTRLAQPGEMLTLVELEKELGLDR